MAINSNLLRQNKFVIEKIRAVGIKRAKEVEKYISSDSAILDIGAGNCNIAETLINDGYKVTAIDVKDLSLVKNIKPLLYDGNKLPFENGRFDVALLLFVLHHCKEPDKIIREAARVAKKIIIMEDVFDNVLEKYVTFAIDSLLNQEFFNHPHSNKRDLEWKKLFSDLELTVESQKIERWRYLINHATYCLKNNHAFFYGENNKNKNGFRVKSTDAVSNNESLPGLAAGHHVPKTYNKFCSPRYLNPRCR